MGLFDEIEDVKNSTIKTTKIMGTTGTDMQNSVITIKNKNKKTGSNSRENEGISPEPQMPPENDKINNSTDLSDQYISATDILKTYKVKYLYIDNETLAKKAVEHLMAVDIIMGIDIETAKHGDYLDHERAGLEPSLSNIRLVQLYAGDKTVFVFDIKKCDMKPLLPILESKEFVAHNAVFELKHLLHAGVNVKNFNCTMLMGNALSGKHHKLSHLVEKCLKIRMSKELQVSDWNCETLTKDQIAYAACDAVLTYHLFHYLTDLLTKCNRNEIYSLMRDAQKAVAQLVLNGIYFDVEAHTQLISNWEEKMQKAYAKLKEHLGENVNPNSGKQLSNWLNENLDEETLKQLSLTPKGDLKTTMDDLSKISNHPLVKPLVEYKKYKKLISSFGTSYSQYVNPVTKKLHGDFSIAGTTTGRFTCFKPNVQNPPRSKDFRSLFKATPGNVFVVADYGQMQLRIVAILSKDRKMLKAYKDGVDLHQMTAAAVSGVPIEQVTKEQRQLAKAVNFGFIFGQGTKSFKAKTEADYGISITDREAQQSRNAFFNTYLGLKQWQKTTARIAEQNMKITTPCGRVRDFSREKNGYRYTEALNTPVQGAEAEVVLAVLSMLEEYLEGIDAKLVNIIHDEFVFEVAEKDKEKALVAVEKVMIAGMLKIFPEATTLGLVDAHVGDNWASAKQ